MFGIVSEKFRTFDMRINFAMPPISHFRRWLGEFFFLYQSCEILITLSINSLGKLKTFLAFSDSPHVIIGRFTTIPIYLVPLDGTPNIALSDHLHRREAHYSSNFNHVT